ncbi:hypothetical protein NQ317_000785 [Molorchus minor]|uniref:SWIM-type domain-containing protein n=1 Tax=Molorchus minor TaxID=1323400 RepID=A0ABQ9J493_9CUCU|nr:hypothetical protein NQ317_000785 [Molorchus minor]
MNCPSTLNITLKAINKKFRGKPENAGDPEMPCIIVYIATHNHNIFSADAYRFRRVSEKTREKLIDLFKLGHSPGTALETLKIELQLSTNSYEKLLADRSICPDYNYCYHIFMQEFKARYGPIDFSEDGKRFLVEKLKEYNITVGEECAKINITDVDYIITLCPPLFKRIHQNISFASEIVFMDSTGTVDHGGSKVFIISTQSECGGLPLGLIITSSECAQNIAVGLEMLKSMLGNTIFYGKVEGPQVFMLDDCEAEHIAIRSVWPNSKCLLCVFHVLQSVYRWLVNAKNGIPKNAAMQFFKQFRSIMYSPTVLECEQLYNSAVEAAKEYKNYTQYLHAYWQKRDMWAISYRAWLLVRGNHTNNISEAAMRLLKEKIFNRVKAFNNIQLVDFLLSKFVDYYKRRLLDAAHNRLIKDKLLQTIALPATNVVNKIKNISDNVFFVPSESTADLHYLVYTDVLICTCFRGNTGTICKHIDWLHMLYHSEETNQDEPEKTKEEFSRYIVDLNTNESTVDTQNETDALKSAVEEGQKLVGEFSEHLTSFLNQSPLEILAALRKMMERTKKMKTVNAFVSSCSTFGSEFHRKNLGARIPVQPTAVARQKTNITGKSSHVGGRPRQGSKIRKKVPHKISKHIT